MFEMNGGDCHVKRLVSLFLVTMLAQCLAIPAAFAEDTVLRVAGWPAGDEAFKAIIPEFEATHPGIKVELIFNKQKHDTLRYVLILCIKQK